MPTSLTVFADTNIFLQCKLLQDLPWSEVGAYDEINVIVPPTVLDEIDDHSHGGSDRRAKRARKALEIIDGINNSPKHVHILREKSPRVTVALGAYPPMGAEMPYPLRENKPDHCIVFECQCLAKDTTGPSIFITIDRAQVSLARTLNLNHFQAPEAWRLPPESTDQDKHIKTLEATIQALQSTQPIIELQLLNEDGTPLADGNGSPINLATWNPAGHLDLTIQDYPKLDSSQARDIASLAQAMHSMQTDFTSKSAQPTWQGRATFDPFMGREWIPPSAESISQYRDKAYPDWIKSVELWADQLSGALNSTANLFVLRLAMSNTGGVPATSATINVEIAPEGLAFDASIKRKAAKGPPSHPAPPQGHFDSIYDRFAAFGRGYPVARILQHHLDIPRIGPPQRHDPFAFYYHPRRPDWPSQTVGYMCDSFRHKIDPEVFAFTIRSLPGDKRPEKGALHIQVTADNLPIPVQITIPLGVIYERLDTVQKARELLAHPNTGTDDDVNED